MNAKEKKAFVAELMASVQSDILDNVELMPEEWDGHELRRYIADMFSQCAMTIGRDKRYTKRFRAYKNEIIIRNL